MALISTDNPWLFAFGVLGNIVSFVVFLAPLPTFYRVCKKKSTEGFQSIPYVAALFSSMLWIYYASQKSNSFLLITINAFGSVVETIYLAIYITYAPKQARISTLRILTLLNFGGFCCVLLFSHFLTKGATRIQVLGWISMAFSLCVFAAPLSIVRQVIRTKSVEFMPFYLSFFLTLSAIAWLFYGIFLKDLYVAVPNIAGFILGLFQMVLYAAYKNRKPVVMEEVKVAEHSIDILKPSTIEACGEQELCSQPNQDKSNNNDNNNTDTMKNNQVVKSEKIVESGNLDQESKYKIMV